MALVTSYASFIRHRQEDGTYVVIYPINTSDEVYVDINTKLTLTSKINTMDAAMTADRESIVMDMLSVMSALGPMIPKPLLLNHIYADDFSNETITTINISKGINMPGKIVI
jgi:hypothetical protein